MVSPSTSNNFTPKVSFFFDQVKFSLTKRTELKKFIEQLFKKEGRQLKSLNYIFCSDKKLLEINRQFLNHDYFTDIITFDLSENTDATSPEIYISIDRVRDNALNHDESFRTELHRVIFHGALHLCGYGDKTKAQILKMREREDYYLTKYRKWGFTCHYLLSPETTPRFPWNTQYSYSVRLWSYLCSPCFHNTM